MSTCSCSSAKTFSMRTGNSCWTRSLGGIDSRYLRGGRQAMPSTKKTPALMIPKRKHRTTPCGSQSVHIVFVSSTTLICEVLLVSNIDEETKNSTGRVYITG